MRTLLPFFLLFAPALAQAPVERSRLEPPSNRWGAPVETPDGDPMTYTRAQLAAQRDAAKGGLDNDAGLAPPNCEDGGAIAGWKYFAFGTGIGAAGIAVSYGESEPEIVISAGGYGFGGNRFWMVLSHDAATDAYQQRWVSPIYSSGVGAIDASDLEGDGDSEVVVLTGDALVEIWDQNSRTLESSFPVPSGTDVLHLYDFDGDGIQEILVCSSSLLRVFSPSGAIELAAPIGGSDMGCGQMDADPSMEIAFTTGEVFDVDTQSVQWTWGDGFGSFIEVGDIDDDGMDEVIGTQTWGYAFAYDVDTELPKWSIEIFNVGATDLVDVDADGTLELIIGEAQWGDQLGIDTKTLVTEWAIYNPEHGTTEVLCADADSDGVMEVIWGSGHTSTGEDRMFVGDWVSLQHEWSSVHLDGPFRAPVSGDVDGDGVDEIVTVTNESDSGYGSGRILVFDAPSLALELLGPEVANGLGWSGTWEVELHDVDDDPALEILVATSTTYDGTIEIWDVENGVATRIWEVPNPKPDGAFLDATIADVDQDGDLEVLGGAQKYVHVYDLETATLEWSSLFIASQILAVTVGNTDEDPSPEILAVGSQGDLYVFDGTTKALSAIVGGAFNGVATSEMGVRPDLIRLSTTGGELVTVAFLEEDYQVLETLDLLDETIDGFHLRTAHALLVGAGGVLYLFDPMGGDLIWESCAIYGDPFGTGMAFTDTHAVTAGLYGLVGFQRP